MAQQTPQMHHGGDEPADRGPARPNAQNETGYAPQNDPRDSVGDKIRETIPTAHAAINRRNRRRSRHRSVTYGIFAAFLVFRVRVCYRTSGKTRKKIRRSEVDLPKFIYKLVLPH